MSLGGTTQQELLAKYRYTNVDEDWWTECVVEDFKDDMSQIGFDVTDVCYSVGYCQSDYASFSGRVDDWAKMFRHFGLLINWFYYDRAELGFSVTAQGRQGRQHLSDYMNPGENPYDEEDQPLQFDLYEMQNARELEIAKLEKSLEELCKEKSTELYRRLRDEHEYLTSDECIVGFILENCREEIEEHLSSLEDAC